MTRATEVAYVGALTLGIGAVLLQLRGNPVGAVVLAINGVTLAVLTVAQALTSNKRP